MHDITDETSRRVILTSKDVVNTIEMDFKILELIPGEENIIVWTQ
jgi:hypothetical protein